MNSGAEPNRGFVAAVNNAASGAVNAVANAVTNAATGAANAVANVANHVVTNVNKAANAVPTFNSMIPFGNGVATNNNGKKNNGAGAGNQPPANNGILNMAGNVFENMTTSPDQGQNIGINNSIAPVAATFGNFSVTKNNGAGAAAAGWATPLSIFIGLVSLFLVAFAVFNKQIKQGYEYIAQSVKNAIGGSTSTDVVASIVPSDGVTREITMPPQAPQDILPAQANLQHQSIVEKILPSALSNEVFNVAQNKFTYYDAEPLCKALGAELATYEQVKDAWGKGADWCNYGWVKGQMAVYPTQKETYEKLQMGPADEQGACGTVGINGGNFENPEMQFGVNCYGKKPGQSAHDEAQLMSEGKIPKSLETLKVDKMTAEFKKEADSLFVKPFNDHKWSTAF